MIELYQLYRRSYYIKKLLTIRREDTFTLQPTKENYWKNALYKEETFIKTLKESSLRRQWAHSDIISVNNIFSYKVSGNETILMKYWKFNEHVKIHHLTKF